ncbi:MAG: hypothetical protein HC778_02210 [Chamaesiphon sp. CSU_1_12]|nr:hypothetical protein [Chamaesiphon sp. CSU_1_12]
MSSYDSGASLGANLRQFRRDGTTAADYSQVAVSQYYREPTPFEVFERAAVLKPEAAAIWQQQIAKITPEQVDRIFEAIPDDRGSPEAIRFAKETILYNRDRIVNLQLERSPSIDFDKTMRSNEEPSKQSKVIAESPKTINHKQNRGGR